MKKIIISEETEKKLFNVILNENAFFEGDFNLLFKKEFDRLFKRGVKDTKDPNGVQKGVVIMVDSFGQPLSYYDKQSLFDFAEEHWKNYWSNNKKERRERISEIIDAWYESRISDNGSIIKKI